MLKNKRSKLIWTSCLFFPFLFTAGPAQAFDSKGLPSLFFFVFVYPFLLLLGLVTHFILIFSKSYTYIRTLWIALVMIGILTSIGLVPARLFTEDSIPAALLFSIILAGLIGIPLYQYWHHAMSVETSPHWRDRFRWSLCGAVLLFLIAAGMLFYPGIDHYRSMHHKEQWKQEQKAQKQRSEELRQEKQNFQQELLDKKEKNKTGRVQQQEQRAKVEQEHYTQLLEAVLSRQPAEAVKLRTMTSSEVRQHVESGVLPRSVDGYFVDQSQALDVSKIDALKTILCNPAFYHWEYPAVINPVIRNSQRVYAVLFGDEPPAARVLFYLDNQQLTIIDAYDTGSVKFNDERQVEQFFSEIGLK
jgi:hypothetical protein